MNMHAEVHERHAGRISNSPCMQAASSPPPVPVRATRASSRASAAAGVSPAEGKGRERSPANSATAGEHARGKRAIATSRTPPSGRPNACQRESPLKRAQFSQRAGREGHRVGDANIVSQSQTAQERGVEEAACGSLVELIIWLMCAWWLVAQVFAPDFAALTGMLESMRRCCVALLPSSPPSHQMREDTTDEPKRVRVCAHPRRMSAHSTAALLSTRDI